MQYKVIKIMRKLDEILANQFVILSRINIRDQPGAVVEVRSTVPSPQPISISMPMELEIPGETVDVTVSSKPTIANTAPVVNDIMLSEPLKLKPKSSSAGNLVAKLISVVFKSDELTRIEIVLVHVEKKNSTKKNYIKYFTMYVKLME